MGNDEKELDEYGVWVKSGEDAASDNLLNTTQNENTGASLNQENLDDITIDLNDEAVNEIQDDSFFELEELDAITGKNNFVPLNLEDNKKEAASPFDASSDFSSTSSDSESNNIDEFQIDSSLSSSDLEANSELDSSFSDTNFEETNFDNSNFDDNNFSTNPTVGGDSMSDQSILKNILDEIKNIKSDIDSIKSDVEKLKREKSNSDENDDAAMFNDENESISLSNDELSDIFVESEDVVSADTISSINNDGDLASQYEQNAIIANDLISTNDDEITLDFDSDFDNDIIDLDSETLEESIIKDNPDARNDENYSLSIFGDEDEEEFDEIDDFQFSDDDFPQMIDTKNYNDSMTTLDEDIKGGSNEEQTLVEAEDDFVITPPTFDSDSLNDDSEISFEFEDNNAISQESDLDQNDISDEPTLQEAVNIDDLEIGNLIEDDIDIDTKQVALAAAEAGFAATAPQDDEIFNDDLVIEDGLTLNETLNVTQATASEEVANNEIALQSEGTPSIDNKELVDLLGYLDNLLDSLPDEKIKEFANSPYFDIYKKIFNDLGIK